MRPFRLIATLVVLADCGGGGTMPGVDASLPDSSGTPDVSPPPLDASEAEAEACAVTCGGQCSDPMTDPNNCGKCGNGCKSGYPCTEGVCGNAIVQVAATYEAACALLHDGDVWCWGGQDFGELGTATSSSTPTPQKIVGLSDVKQMAGDAFSLCALDGSGDVWCWGYNIGGSLGHDVGAFGDVICAQGPNRCNPTPRKVTFPTVTKIARVAVGFYNACAISVAGDLWCWGAAGIFPTSASLPGKVPGFSGDAVDVGVGTAMCAVNKAGSVLCAGYNPNGELGHVPGTSGDTSNGYEYWNHTPTVVPSVANATSIRVAEGHACALTSSGDVYCWCSDVDGAVGNGTYDGNYHGPTKVFGGATTVLGLNANNTLVATGDAGAWAWGDNSFGQVGTGGYGGPPCYYGTPCQPSPVGTPGLDGVTVAALGYGVGLGLSQSGTVLAWGLNQYDQLGHAAGSGDDSCHEAWLSGDAGVPCQAKITAMPVFP